MFSNIIASTHSITKMGNRLLNWPKLLEVYANGFYSIFVPEYVPYIIPHIFHIKNFIYSLKILCFNQFYTSKQRNQLHDKHGACAICVLVTPRCHLNCEGDLCVYRAYNYAS